MEVRVNKLLSGVILICFSHLALLVLQNLLVEPETVRMVTRVTGGSCGIYFLFLAQRRFSKLFSLFYFLVNTCYLFVLNHLSVPEIVLVPICICGCFCVSYFFIEEGKILGKSLDRCFILILTWRALVAPDMFLLSYLFELLVLFSLRFRYMNGDRKGLCYYLVILLFLTGYYQYVSGNQMNLDHLVLIFVLAAAGAGGIQFMSLSKTERGETLGFALFFLNNVILGFLLRKDEETLPMITISFLIAILCFCIGLALIGRIKEQSLYSILSEFKSTLRGVFIPLLLILDNFFLEGEYNIWITSLITRIIVLQLLQLILKKEDTDQNLYKEKKGNNVQRCKIHRCRSCYNNYSARSPPGLLK